MIERLGKRKVVWKDEGRTKVIRGETVLEDLFVKVTSDGKGTVWINKDVVIVIKGISDC